VYDAILFSIMAMFFYGTSAVLTTFVSELFPTNIRATAVGAVAGMGINMGFALYPVIVAHLVENNGWQMTFSLVVVPSLFIAGLATLFQPNLRSGDEIG
jgi:MFS family permease